MASTTDTDLNKPRSPNRFWLGMRRGLAGKCPNCGEGRLYLGYLKVLSPCTVCGNDNLQYPSDDAAPYFTILLIGHLVVAPFLFLSFVHTAPLWIVIGTTIPAILVITLVALPYIKGAVIGAMWSMDFTRKSTVFVAESAEPENASLERGVAEQARV